MTPTDLTARVTHDACVAVAALAVLGAWLGGGTAVVGTVAGGALAVVSFRWLTSRAAAAAAAGGTPAGAWVLGAGLRFGVCMAACALLLSTGWAHPVALVLGVSVLPCAVIVEGLRAAKGER